MCLQIPTRLGTSPAGSQRRGSSLHQVGERESVLTFKSHSLKTFQWSSLNEAGCNFLWSCFRACSVSDIVYSLCFFFLWIQMIFTWKKWIWLECWKLRSIFLSQQKGETGLKSIHPWRVPRRKSTADQEKGPHRLASLWPRSSWWSPKVFYGLTGQKLNFLEDRCLLDLG